MTGTNPTTTPAGRRSSRDLGDGLILRWSTEADRERIAEFNAQVFRNQREDPPNARVRAQTLDFMSGRHPLIGPSDFVIVEDTRVGKIVAGTCLMAQEWEYEGIRLAVGRPEWVATDPDYRNRGLIRAIFAAVHEESAARGQIVQAITGIPYFYRQFGYEYALDLDGYRTVQFTAIPDMPEGQQEPFTLREATPNDLPFIMALYEQHRTRGAISAVAPEAFWRSTFDAVGLGYSMHWRLWVIRDASGAPSGFARTSALRWRGNFNIWDLVARDGVSLHAAAPAVLRALRPIAEATPDGDPTFDQKPCTALSLIFGHEHPVYDVLGPAVTVATERPYAWYVRVPDLPALLLRLAPALNRRLAASAMAGYSGDLRLDFYRGGLRLTFTSGELTAVAPWQRPHWGERQQAGFPPLVFLQLLFGRRSLDELKDAYPDVLADDEATPLLNALFPKRVTNVIYLE